MGGLQLLLLIFTSHQICHEKYIDSSLIEADKPLNSLFYIVYALEESRKNTQYCSSVVTKTYGTIMIKAL
jgi:hypothetical protein